MVTSVVGSPIRVTLVVPARFDGPIDVTIQATDVAALSRITTTGVPVSRAFDIEVRALDGTLIQRHDRPITIVVAIENPDIVLAAGDRRRLRLARWDSSQSSIAVLDTRLDESASTLTAETSRTSTFLIVTGDAMDSRAAAWVPGPFPTHVIPMRLPRVGSAIDSSPDAQPIAPFPVHAGLAAALLFAVAVPAWAASRSGGRL